MNTAITQKHIEDAGVGYGFARTRRHPTVKPFLADGKDRTDMFDTEQTHKHLSHVLEYATKLAQTGKTLLFVGGKPEVAAIVRATAESAGQPYVAGRWIGGTLTNFKNIRTRLERLEKLTGERERGELTKYTKRERLMIDREIDELMFRFGGIAHMHELPAALFVVDTRHEHTAVAEANQMNIPVVGLASSDCDFSVIQYPIPGNDSTTRSVKTVCEAVSHAYVAGKRVTV